VRELEAKLEEGGRDSSDLSVLQQRLAEELEDERTQHQKDIDDRDFTADQTRKKYQGKSWDPQRISVH
jgi:myosin protein heavy chain